MTPAQPVPATLADFPQDGPIGVQLGLAPTREDLPNVYEDTHDRLIEFLGDKRRGGVRWLVYEASVAPHILEVLGIDTNRGDIMETLGRFPEGLLVVAIAPRSDD